MISTQTPVQTYQSPAAATSSATAKADRTQLSEQKVNCLAKALYDNVAEAPDELAFRKGDVLTVLEQNTNGLEGWWLCSLRGRQGIAPGNRLRLLPGMYDPSGLGYAGGTPGQMGERASHARRRSWKINPNKVITPQKIGEVYMYDVPVSARISETYDTPQPSSHLCKSHPTDCVLQGCSSYDTPPSPRAVSIHPAYDEPRPLSQQYDMPKPYLAYDKPRSYDHSKLSAPLQNVPKINDYDVPNSDSEAYDIPGPPRVVERQHISKTNDNSHSHLQNVVIPYDIPPSHTRSACSSCDLPSSKRSSGVSLMSTSSVSMLSPSSSESSLNTSLSLSSIGGSNRSSMEQQMHEVYDIPPPNSRVVDSSLQKPHLNTVIPHPSSLLHFCHGNGHQDFTKHFMSQFYETPPTPRPTLQYTATEGVYDVPPQVTKDVSTILKNCDDDCMKRFSSSSTDSREFKENFPNIEGKELPLDLDGAMERLVKLHEEVQSTISKLFSFVSATWRKHDSMESKVFDIKTTCHKLCSVLQEFLSFIYGALANSTHSPDRTLCHKLGKLIMPLNDSNSVVQTTTQALDDKEWQVSKLATEDNSSTPDELDQLVACARVLVEDVRQVASFIQGNCTLIFKRSQLVIGNKPLIAHKSMDLKDRLCTTVDNAGNMNCLNNQIVQDRPLPVPPQKNDGLHHPLSSLENSNKEFINDYDYVNLESKESVERENEEIKAALPKQLHKSFENLVKQSYIPVDNDISKFPVIKPADGNWSSSLEPSELQVLKFYSIQLDTHMAFLTNAIDAFLLTIENNQPPKVFIGHSKFVIISAHKLVYIGDTVHRNISNSDIKSRVMQAANNLCDSLKTLVLSTKKAALQFPSVLAVQEMVDSVVDVSHLASELKTILAEAAKL